jgi:hypothetical protein
MPICHYCNSSALEKFEPILVLMDQAALFRGAGEAQILMFAAFLNAVPWVRLRKNQRKNAQNKTADAAQRQNFWL